MIMATNFAAFLDGWIDAIFRAHPAVAILLVSALGFLGGYRDLADGRRKEAFTWQLITVIITGGFSIGALFSGMWAGSITAVVLFGFEIWLMKRWFGAKPR